jgi:hypothetical protein
VKKRIAVGVAGTLVVLGLAYVPGRSPEPGFKTLHFHKDQISQLQNASDWAAQCGGEVQIDSDDGEILVGECKR